MSGADQLNGGAAFPGQGSAVCIPADMMDRAHEIKVRNDGMTLRDYFAAKALPAYMTYITTQGVMLSRSHEEIATECYLIAAAMLKARQS